jgi:hypothetical protein
MATLNLDRSPRHPAPPSWTRSLDWSKRGNFFCFFFWREPRGGTLSESLEQDFAETALGLLAEVEADAAALDGSDGEWED